MDDRFGLGETHIVAHDLFLKTSAHAGLKATNAVTEARDGHGKALV